LNINDYVSQFENVINSYLIVSSYNLNIDKKSEEIVYISGRIDFRNGSILDFKEFVEYKYSYNYRKMKDLIFRYDNAPDPKAKRLNSFPHHKHLIGGDIVESGQIEYTVVLKMIEEIILGEL